MWYCQHGQVGDDRSATHIFSPQTSNWSKLRATAEGLDVCQHGLEFKDNTLSLLSLLEFSDGSATHKSRGTKADHSPEFSDDMFTIHRQNDFCSCALERLSGAWRWRWMLCPSAVSVRWEVRHASSSPAWRVDWSTVQCVCGALAVHCLQSTFQIRQGLPPFVPPSDVTRPDLHPAIAPPTGARLPFSCPLGSFSVWS